MWNSMKSKIKSKRAKHINFCWLTCLLGWDPTTTFYTPTWAWCETRFQAQAAQSSERTTFVYLEALVNPASALTWAPDPGWLQWGAGSAFWSVLCDSQELHLENHSCGFINGLSSDVTSVSVTMPYLNSSPKKKSMLSSFSTSVSNSIKVCCINIPYHHQILSQ